MIKIDEFDTQKHKFGKIRKEKKKALKILNKEITNLSKRKGVKRKNIIIQSCKKKNNSKYQKTNQKLA
jgi:hypothetical protein